MSDGAVHFDKTGPGPRKGVSRPERRENLHGCRSCIQIYDMYEGMEVVLRQSAVLLHLDPDYVVRSGTVLRGTTRIQSRREESHTPKS